MTTSTIHIPANERGVVRVFALSLDDAQAKALKDTPEAMAQALGTDAMLDSAHVEVFPVSDLDRVGLSGFLIDGAGVPDRDVAPDRLKLDQLDGWVLILFSLATRDAEVTLQPAATLTLIGTYGETRTEWTGAEPLDTDSAKPYSAPAKTVRKKPSDAAMSGRVATLVLIVLALFTYIFIRIAG